MSEHHPLKTFLNIHLASDVSTLLHLPFILDSLTSENLAPSSHLPKWIARVQSLLHSKDIGGRWAGMVLAQKSVLLSQGLLLEYGQSWAGVALLSISKNDTPVVLKAAIRLLKTILTHTHEVSEFRRQVATPVIPKLLIALVPLVEQTKDIELKVVAMITLVNLITLYPTLHKTSYPALSSLALSFLDGISYAPASHNLLDAASRLYSVIHVTGGKLGASSLWRKTLDETLAFGVNAFWSLRTTFAAQGMPDFFAKSLRLSDIVTTAPVNVSVPANEDPVTFIPLQLDRLNCAIIILDDLMGATVYRPVQLPLGIIVRFALQLLRSTDNPKDGFLDPIIHTLELSVIPRIQILGCSLIISLAERVDCHLGPHITQILIALADIIELHRLAEHHCIIFHTLETVLKGRSSSHSPQIAMRLMKVIVPFISRVLSSPDTGSKSSAPAKGRRSKKKIQSYEGDEVFSLIRVVICPTDLDGKVFLTALEVVRFLLRDPNLPAAMQSISVRVVLAMLFEITRMPPARFSPDPCLYSQVINKLHEIAIEIASGTSSTLSKSLPLVIMTISRGCIIGSQRQLDLLLHPRLPPLMRPMPLAENISLIFSEESHEEAELRQSLGLYTNQTEIQQHLDIEMGNSTPQPPEELMIHISSHPSNPSETTLPVVRQELISATQSQLKGKEKAISSPKLISKEAQVDEERLIPYQPSVMEAPILQFSQPPSRAHQSGPSDSIPISVRDEDEEMPTIDLDSDSDPDSE